MTADVTPRHDSDSADARLRRKNLRTALVLASIAVVFFFGVLVARFIGDGSTGVTLLSAAVMLFLVIAIARNLRK
ncbi:MAG: hypothetical protein IT521_14965 [Burkholderiales bacterium]|nr:hypothetical protein [Burkholderiales bacterium]